VTREEATEENPQLARRVFRGKERVHRCSFQFSDSVREVSNHFADRRRRQGGGEGMSAGPEGRLLASSRGSERTTTFVHQFRVAVLLNVGWGA
jgi:hypothetical protein